MTRRRPPRGGARPRCRRPGVAQSRAGDLHAPDAARRPRAGDLQISGGKPQPPTKAGPADHALQRPHWAGVSLSARSRTDREAPSTPLKACGERARAARTALAMSKGPTFAPQLETVPAQPSFAPRISANERTWSRSRRRACASVPTLQVGLPGVYHGARLTERERRRGRRRRGLCPGA